MNDSSRADERTNAGGSAQAPVYDVLRSQIIDGTLSPGTNLVEGTLASQFNVSRSPIREAIGRLTHEGLLERHGRAMRVRVLKAEDILEIYEVRIALERAAARAAAERRTELDLGRLSTLMAEMKALDPEATDRRAKLAHAFHFELWRASHNDMLQTTLESVHVQVLGLSSTTLHYPERWSVFVAECEEIVDAVRNRDIDTAGSVAERQMTNARDFRIQLYSSNPGALPARHPLGR
jgi:DNA-binding GntR family transcriptional regulator